jgi:uncharacterized protein YegL
MDKMNVVTFKATNHVLGAVVRSAQADKPLTVTDVAANGIAVRDSTNAGLHALIDATQLQVAVVDYDTRVFYRPQLFVVDDGRIEQQDEDVVTATTGSAGLVLAQGDYTVVVFAPGYVTAIDLQTVS